jgi:hypothetical protein
MSGIEIVPLVLAAFPILISATQAYRNGLKPLRFWRHYRKSVSSLWADVQIQAFSFEDNLVGLLEPVTTSPHELKLLLSHPDGPEWRAPELEDKLKARLARFYSPIMTIINRMHETLEQLQNNLGIVDGKVSEGLSFVNSEGALGIRSP